MNERIRQIVREAGLDDDEFPIENWDNVPLAKFAELIVRECISINRQRLFSDYEGDSHRVAHNNALLCANSDMFEHFGVEE